MPTAIDVAYRVKPSMDRAANPMAIVSAHSGRLRIMPNSRRET
jgi:hypothetical protein